MTALAISAPIFADDWIPKTGEKVLVVISKPSLLKEILEIREILGQGKHLLTTDPHTLYYAKVGKYYPLDQRVSFWIVVVGRLMFVPKIYIAALNNVARLHGCTDDKTICVGYEAETEISSEVVRGKVVKIFSDNSIAIEAFHKGIFKIYQNNVSVTRSGFRSCCSIG